MSKKSNTTEFIGNAEEIYKLETNLKQLNKQHSYLPLINFHGAKECFNKLESYENIFIKE